MARIHQLQRGAAARHHLLQKLMDLERNGEIRSITVLLQRQNGDTEMYVPMDVLHENPREVLGSIVVLEHMLVQSLQSGDL